MSDFAIGFLTGGLLLLPVAFCLGAIYGAHRLAREPGFAQHVVSTTVPVMPAASVETTLPAAITEYKVDLSSLPVSTGGRLVIVRKGGYVVGRLDLDEGVPSDGEIDDHKL